MLAWHVTTYLILHCYPHYIFPQRLSICVSVSFYHLLSSVGLIWAMENLAHASKPSPSPSLYALPTLPWFQACVLALSVNLKRSEPYRSTLLTLLLYSLNCFDFQTDFSIVDVWLALLILAVTSFSEFLYLDFGNRIYTVLDLCQNIIIDGGNLCPVGVRHLFGIW